MRCVCVLCFCETVSRLLTLYPQVATHSVMSNKQLQELWVQAVKNILPSEVSNEVIIDIGQALIFKMLHSQTIEFTVGTRMLETLKAGKTADVDVALRLKLKSHASKKNVNNI